MPGPLNLEPLTAPGDHAANHRASGATPDRRRALMVAGSILAIIASIAFIAYQIFPSSVSAGAESRRRTLIDAETGEVFEDFPIRDGDRQPWTNPKTGKPSLFPAERCFWTRDGKAKLTPTWVLLNRYANKPGDTICPDCGRRVVPHNPAPPDELFNELLAPGGQAPPGK